ncbi:MAG: aspartyl/glutamyl-tRNA(Asn/Gln) amidotransferase subunit, partial [Chthonomonadales bacterium]|nr:aspartyl/glutamyl-tRNA(Asn/Gln) amidotransferase subunit [Chthonomonadales bacterium]
MALSHEEVRKVALLARLELTDGEIASQAKHLNDLLGQFEKLQALDVTGIEPTSHSIPIVNVLR